MFTINYLKKGKMYWSSFPLINLNSENIKWDNQKDVGFPNRKLSRYSSIEREGLFKGGYFWSSLEREDNEDYRVALGHQKFFDGKAVRCETWSKSCRKKEPSFVKTVAGVGTKSLVESVTSFMINFVVKIIAALLVNSVS